MTKEQCKEWVENHIPVAIKPFRKTKTVLVYPYTNVYAREQIVDHLSKELYKLLNNKDEKTNTRIKC